MRIAVDVGYGYTKGISDTGKWNVFPSVVAPAQDRTMMALFGGDGREDEYVRLREGGDVSERFIGTLALRSPLAAYAIARDRVDHPATRLLLAAAVARLMPEVQNSGIHLITGLPFEHYRTQRERFESMLRNLDVTVEFPEAGKVRRVRFERVTLFVQGGASIYAWLFDDFGRLKRHDLWMSGAVVSAVNVGFRTVDIVSFRLGDRVTLEPALSFTIEDELGGIMVRRMVQDAFYRETGYRPSLAQVEEILGGGGTVRFEGRLYDFGDTLRQARRMIAEAIRDHLIARLGDRLSFIHTILLTGGGALELKPYLDLGRVAVEVDGDGQFADARGYLILGRMIEAQERARVTPESLSK
ncbi:MAG: hypothetical protein HSCHL_2028 [Hydrogenibacillus schlegelii]|uniref:Uncharacterized protein n=1 Tax=Hydrogenibacillus schlegelii TaxID=1484 RepID=A0A2T5G432_HYDSH|nr:ParM/StbA family protein [Hydrogenibacillus schlegelii]PTQ50939.1 MAG: hypothetical protein HSCHL_2028 [Hydrogenibacillus schlegelii]